MRSHGVGCLPAEVEEPRHHREVLDGADQDELGGAFDHAEDVAVNTSTVPGSRTAAEMVTTRSGHGGDREPPGG